MEKAPASSFFPSEVKARVIVANTASDFELAVLKGYKCVAAAERSTAPCPLVHVLPSEARVAASKAHADGGRNARLNSPLTLLALKGGMPTLSATLIALKGSAPAPFTLGS